MHRISYFFLFSILALLGQGSYQVCKRCNSDQILGLIQYPEYAGNFQQQNPATRDFSRLPEEEYVEEREPGQDGQRLSRDNRNYLPEYQNLCDTVIRLVQLVDDPEYEYQPPYYSEIYCKSYSLVENEERPVPSSKQKCVYPAFHCVQRSKTIVLVRRRWDSECWEPFAKEIASGCDCMWPVPELGDVTPHYKLPPFLRNQHSIQRVGQ